MPLKDMPAVLVYVSVAGSKVMLSLRAWCEFLGLYWNLGGCGGVVLQSSLVPDLTKSWAAVAWLGGRVVSALLEGWRSGNGCMIAGCAGWIWLGASRGVGGVS